MERESGRGGGGQVEILLTAEPPDSKGAWLAMKGCCQYDSSHVTPTTRNKLHRIKVDKEKIYSITPPPETQPQSW